MQQLQFGPWLRTQPMNSNIFYLRKYGGFVSTSHHQRRQQADSCGGDRDDSKNGKADQHEGSEANS